MTFLNPLVLIGLTAAAIPIIIHLLNLRKLKTIEFSSLQFLKELQKTRMRRLRIKQLLLLVLRTLLIVFLVLAFSRPALRGGFAQSLGTHVKTTIAVLLDDSPSMTVRNQRGVLFSQAKESAAMLLNLLKAGDEMYLVKLSDVRHEQRYSPVLSSDAVRAWLEHAGPSQETATYLEGLTVVGHILRTSMNLNKEVYLIGDGQATQFREPTATSRSLTPDSAGSLGPAAKLFLIDVGETEGSPSSSNTGVGSVELATQIVARNKPVMIRTEVHSYPPVELRNATLSAYLDGSRVVQQSFDLSSGAASVTFSVVPKRSGSLAGYVQTEDDILEVDNTRYFVVNVPHNIGILLVGASSEDTRLPFLALTLGNDTSMTKSFTVSRITENQLPSTEVNTYDVAILCNVRDLSQTEGDRLVQFVKAGGGLVIFPGGETNIANLNAMLFNPMAIPPLTGPVHYAGSGPQDASGGRDEHATFLSFGRVDYDHPLFSGLFEKPATGKRSTHAIESPKVYTAFTPTLRRNSRTIIALSNGAGFLTEYQVESGRALVFSVDANLAWSDFPLKGLFAPLLHRIALYAVAQDQTPASFLAGDDIKIRVKLPEISVRGTYVLTTPSGVEERIVPTLRSASGVASFESSNSSEVGIYKLRSVNSDRKSPQDNDQGTLQAIAVNVDPLESDLRRVGEQELMDFYRRLGIKPERARQMPADGHVESGVMESRFGVELWKYFAGLAIIAALAEMLLGREPRRDQQQ